MLFEFASSFQRQQLHHLLLPLPCPSTQQNSPPSLPYTLPQVTADLRTINSIMFATRYSLRFPIIKRLRLDKCPAAANTVQWLEEIGDQGGFLPGVWGNNSAGSFDSHKLICFLTLLWAWAVQPPWAACSTCEGVQVVRVSEIIILGTQDTLLPLVTIAAGGTETQDLCHIKHTKMSLITLVTLSWSPAWCLQQPSVHLNHWPVLNNHHPAAWLSSSCDLNIISILHTVPFCDANSKLEKQPTSLSFPPTDNSRHHLAPHDPGLDAGQGGQGNGRRESRRERRVRERVKPQVIPHMLNTDVSGVQVCLVRCLFCVRRELNLN